MRRRELTKEERMKIAKSILEDMEDMEKKEELLNNDAFYNWLINVTRKETIKYNTDMQDDSNFDKLPLLFEIIDDYAEKNYLLPIVDGNSKSYFILINYVYLMVSQYDLGTSQIYLCGNVDGECDELDDIIINFNDIKNNKRSKNTILLDKTIKNLKKSINYLMDNGVKEDYLKYVIDEIVSERTTKGKSYSKVKIVPIK